MVVMEHTTQICLVMAKIIPLEDPDLWDGHGILMALDGDTFIL